MFKFFKLITQISPREDRFTRYKTPFNQTACKPSYINVTYVAVSAVAWNGTQGRTPCIYRKIRVTKVYNVLLNYFPENSLGILREIYW